MPDHSEVTEQTDSSRRYALTVSIFAMVLFGLSVRSGPWTSFAALTATAALLLVTPKLKTQTFPIGGRHTDIRLLLGLLLFVALGLAGWAPSTFGPTSQALESLPWLVWGTLGIVVFLFPRDPSRPVKVGLVAIAISLTALVGLFHIWAADGVGIDVLFLHKSAAHAIAQGQNPYTDTVAVPNGAPTAEAGDLIEGYVYPPVTAIAYAIGEWSFSDPRYTSLVAWLAFLAAIGLTGVKRNGKSTILLFLLVAAVPGWPFVLRAAWTEPLSLALASGAFIWWAHSVVSGIFLGLTLGSKQYFVVAAPIVALYRDRHWLRRVTWAAAMLVITVGTAIALDASAFWESAVAFHTSTPPRADSINLVGLMATIGIDWRPPSFLPIVVGLATAVWAGLHTKERQQFFFAMAVTLAASFMVSSQAFANYWLLVFGLCALALVSSDHQGASTAPPAELP